MFYEVRADIFFTEEDEAVDFFHDCQLALPKGTVVNPGQENQQCSAIDYLKCHHDDNPNTPCELIDHEDDCP